MSVSLELIPNQMMIFQTFSLQRIDLFSKLMKTNFWLKIVKFSDQIMKPCF